MLLEGRPDGASVQLSQPFPSETHLPPGLPVQLAFPSGAMVLQTPARVANYYQGILTAQYAGAGRLVQRREKERFPCNLGVTYRAIRSDKSYGAWKQGYTEDISEGGLALIAEGHIQFPPMIEMHIALPAQTGWIDPTRPHGMDDCLSRASESAAPLRATGTARHGKFRPDGTTFIGVKFAAVAPVAKLRLLRFLETSTGEPPQVEVEIEDESEYL